MYSAHNVFCQLHIPHTLVLPKPQWSPLNAHAPPPTCKYRDIGQLWDGKLRQRAARLIDDVSEWTQVYTLKPVYTSKGRCGVLFCAYPGPWQLYSIADVGGYVPGEAVQAGKLLLSGDTEFEREAIVQALKQHAAGVQG